MKQRKTFDEIGAAVLERSTPESLQAAEAFIKESTRIIDLALAVRDARIAGNLTQAELSKISGITQAEISRIEGAKYAPRVGTLFKLAAALNTSFIIGSTPAAIRVPALAV